MKVKCGIVGLPNVGKSTLFNILTNMAVKVANYPFCTIQPNIAVVQIPDPRICQLTNIVQSNQSVYDIIEFIDIAGLIKGASKGEGLGNKILIHICEATILCHMVRCFDDSQIVHIAGNINPKRDIDIINTELILFDISRCEKKILLLKKNHKKFDEHVEYDLFILSKCLTYLYNGISLRKVLFSSIEKINVQKFNFLTFKPIIYVANIGTNSKNNVYLDSLNHISLDENVPIVSCCASLFSLNNSSSKNNWNVNIIKQQQHILKNIIDHIFSILNLCTFFTVNKRVTRAWVDKCDIKALEASGKVHSDFKTGFIRVQVIKFNDFINYKGESGVKKVGKIFLEGKLYNIQDGDILKFLFKV